jgi:hypothetical protein
MVPAVRFLPRIRNFCALIMLSFPMRVHLVELLFVELRHLSVGRAEIQPSRGKQR